MIVVEIFIENQRLDLFDDETITLTDSIQNARDPKKIFTEFTQQFNIPATIKNNNIFKHFYNYEISNGFDARKRSQATIKINGLEFKRGFLQLNSVGLKKGKPSLYKVFFTGKTSKIKDIVRDDRISSLTQLDRLDHDYTPLNVERGFDNFCRVVESGGTVFTYTLVSDSNGEICYPFITHTKRYTYTEANGIRNVDELGNIGTEALDLTQLKPAIKLKTIINAIAAKYDFVFKSDFFETPEFNKLFMWLHRDKGQMLSADEDIRIANFPTERFRITPVPVSGVPDIEEGTYELQSGHETATNGRYDLGENFLGGNPVNVNKWEFEFDLIFNNNGVITYEFVDTLTNTVLVSSENQPVQSGVPLEFNYIFEGEAGSIRPDLKIVVQSLAITQLEIDLTITRVGTGGQPSETGTRVGNYSLKNTPHNFGVSTVVIRDQMPSMKVVDFLTSIFQAFNLVALVNDDDEIEIEPLDDFYNNGNKIDITNLVDIESQDIERLEPFSRINFNFEEASTFLAIQRNNLTDKVFGDLTQDLSTQVQQGQAYTGGEYSIDLQFEKMLFERITSDNNNLTSVLYGRFVDEKQDPTVGKPLIFFCKRQDTSLYPIAYENGNTTDNYVRPSNTEELGKSINFGAEVDEFSLNVAQGSLFQRFYRNYILRVFNKQSRLQKIKARIPISLALEYKLNDTFIIDNKEYLINQTRIKLNDLKANIELINRADLLPDPANLTPIARPTITSIDESRAGEVTITFDRPAVTDEQNTTFLAKIDQIAGSYSETKSLNYFDDPTFVFDRLDTSNYILKIVTVENGVQSDIRVGENEIELKIL